jgi:hypothetical protein
VIGDLSLSPCSVQSHGNCSYAREEPQRFTEDTVEDMEVVPRTYRKEVLESELAPVEKPLSPNMNPTRNDRRKQVEILE